MKKLFFLTTIVTGLLTQATVNAAEPVRRAEKTAPGPGDPIRNIVIGKITLDTDRDALADVYRTLTVKAPVELRREVKRFTSHLQNLSPRKQAEFVQTMNRANKLRNKDARQEAFMSGTAKYGGSSLLRAAMRTAPVGDDGDPPSFFFKYKTVLLDKGPPPILGCEWEFGW